MVYTITHASDMTRVAEQIKVSNEPTYVIKSATGKFYSINFEEFDNRNQVFWTTERNGNEIANPYYVGATVENAQVVEETPIVEVTPAIVVDNTPNLEVENIRLTNELKYAKEDLHRVTTEKEEYLARLTNELNTKKALEKKCADYVDKIASLEADVSDLILEKDELYTSNEKLKAIVEENSVLLNKTLGELVKEIVSKQTM